MNEEVEAASVYANLVELRDSGFESRPSTAIHMEPPKLRPNYDEVTINFGKPVIQPDSEDLFSSVTFTSPISEASEFVYPLPVESDLPDDRRSDPLGDQPGGDRRGRGSNPGLVPPIPAPRLSKQKNQSPSTCDILDEEGCVSDSYSNSSDLLPKGLYSNFKLIIQINNSNIYWKEWLSILENELLFLELATPDLHHRPGFNQ